MGQDATKTKEEIIYHLMMNGPSLPVQVAKVINYNILFTSAFLSELLSEKRLKMSHMKIGSSALYFVDGQEPMLERFAHHLKSKEKEAFELIQKKKFLRDIKQEPAIRIALREIKDFAHPVKKGEEIVWRYFTFPEAEVPDIETEKPLTIVIEKPVVEKTVEKVPIEIVEPKKEVKKVKEIRETKTKKKKISSKADEKFLNRVKEFLSKNSIELVDLEGIKKDELMLRVRNDGKEQLLIAYKKKKITDKDIIKAAKKAAEFDLSYSILSMGELPKKIADLKEALKNISEVRKF